MVWPPLSGHAHTLQIADTQRTSDICDIVRAESLRVKSVTQHPAAHRFYMNLYVPVAYTYSQYEYKVQMGIT